MFAPGSVQYLRLLEDTVRDGVLEWEPRVDLLEVRAETLEQDDTQVIVNIDYVVRKSNTQGNLVFPFYLGLIEVPS